MFLHGTGDEDDDLEMCVVTASREVLLASNAMRDSFSYIRHHRHRSLRTDGCPARPQRGEGIRSASAPKMKER